MKIKTSKIVALLLALVFIFSSVAVVASAEGDEPYIRVTSISNAPAGAKGQKLEVYLSPDTTLENAVIELTPSKKLANVSPKTAEGVSGKAEVASTGEIKLAVNGSVKNSDTAKEALLFTITFDFAEGTTDLVTLGVATPAADAKINDKTFGSSFVYGTKADDVYTDMCGIGIPGKDGKWIKSAGVDGKLDTVTVKVDFAMLDGVASVSPVTLNVAGAVHNAKVMTAKDVEAFIADNAADITKAVQAVKGNEKYSYDDFEIKANSVKLNGAAIKASDTYKKGTEYEYTVTLTQLARVGAKVRVVFRPALENRDLYHSSDIPDFETSFVANVGKTVLSKEAMLNIFKEYIAVYSTINPDGPITVNGITLDLNKHIKDASAEKYDLGDFVLYEEIVAFNNSKLQGTEKYSVNEELNVYTVYFDQVNVPKTVLGTAAEAFGKINYGEFAKANVLAINEAIGAFQAFCDSLVNAEWPSAEDVEDDDKDDSKSPDTGSAVGLGSALAVVLALSATAAVVIKKKED